MNRSYLLVSQVIRLVHCAALSGLQGRNACVDICGGALGPCNRCMYSGFPFSSALQSRLSGRMNPLYYQQNLIAGTK